MLVNHGPLQYELLDEWWIEAGMEGFRPKRDSFRAQAATLPVRDVPIAEVEPLQRQLSHGVFNDNPEFGTARERVVNILKAFREDVPLPPIELVRATPDSKCRRSPETAVFLLARDAVVIIRAEGASGLTG